MRSFEESVADLGAALKLITTAKKLKGKALAATLIEAEKIIDTVLTDLTFAEATGDEELVGYLMATGGLEKALDGRYRFTRRPDFRGFDTWRAARQKKAAGEEEGL